MRELIRNSDNKTRRPGFGRRRSPHNGQAKRQVEIDREMTAEEKVRGTKKRARQMLNGV